MITVSISVNGEPIYARTAVNIGPNSDGTHCYKLDCGTIIRHHRKDKAIPLAIKMLEAIKEPKKENRESYD